MKFIDGISIADPEAFQVCVEAKLKELGYKLSKEKVTKEPLKPLNGSIFGRELSHLPLCLVNQGELSLEVPNFLVKLFECIEPGITTEGIFRKAGSVQRQKDLKKCLENGEELQGGVHDVANLVKQFLRGLPTTLIPHRIHDHFVKAHESGNTDVLLLLCASMKLVHLHALRYVMTFFGHVANNSQLNKMNSHNLAVVLTPNIFKGDEVIDVKSSKDTGVRLQKQTALIEWLIENAEQIGFVPDELFVGNSLISNLGSITDIKLMNSPKLKKKAKKRASLNGMLSGIRKMVHTSRGHPYHSDAVVNSNDETRQLATKDDKVKSRVKVKRRSDDNIENVVPRKSPRCDMSSVHKDTPVPVENENTISVIPNYSTPKTRSCVPLESRKRLSSRMRIFGKNHVRGSLDDISKASKVVETGKKSLVASACAPRFGRRLASDSKCLRSSPSLPNVVTSFSTSDKETVKVEINLCSKNIRTTMDGPKLNKRMSMERHFQSDDNIAIVKTQRSKVVRSVSAKHRKIGTKLEGKEVDEEFLKPMVLNRSIRRGKPNTVATGLPSESPYKTFKVHNNMSGNESNFTPVVVTAYNALENVPGICLSEWENAQKPEFYGNSTVKDDIQQVLNFSTESLDLDDEKDNFAVDKDSGVFNLIFLDKSIQEPTLSVDKIVGDKEVLAKKCISIDSGLENSPANDIEEDHKPKHKLRKSSSLNSVKSGVKSFNLVNCSSDDHLNGTECSDVEWENAKTFISRELKNEKSKFSSGLGRPSIIQLLKDKAGSVNATAKQYDAIWSDNTPLKDATRSCPRVINKVAEKKPFSPIKIPDIFNQMSPVKCKIASPCADRTNTCPDPVFKTPIGFPSTRTMKENAQTPRSCRKTSTGRSSERKSVRRSSSGNSTTKKSIDRAPHIGQSTANSPILIRVSSTKSSRRSPRAQLVKVQSVGLRSSNSGTAI